MFDTLPLKQIRRPLGVYFPGYNDRKQYVVLSDMTSMREISIRICVLLVCVFIWDVGTYV